MIFKAFFMYIGIGVKCMVKSKKKQLNSYQILFCIERYFMFQGNDQPIPLAWGDTVRIHGVNLSQKSLGQGLILSKGFTDRNLVYQKYQELKDVNFYRECLFQILPRISFDMNDKLLEETDKNQIEKARKKAGEEINNMFKRLEDMVEDAKEKKAEKGAEDDEEVQKKGFVLYGNEVIFKHVESNAYLKGLVQAAEEGGDGAFKVELGENPCSLSTFQIRSHRTYIKDGDIVYFDDKLLIFHPGSDCYTNFSEKAEPIYLDRRFEVNPIPEDHPCYKYYSERPSSKKPKDFRISVINENKDKCLWKFLRHCDYEQSKDKKLIKSHDIVYFKHTKNSGLVASNLSLPIYFLKEFVEGETESFDCYWQLIPKEGSKECRFWARNVVTGLMMKFGEFDVEIQSDAKDEESSGDGFNDHGLVKLFCTEEGHVMDRGDPIPKDLELEPIIQQYQAKINKFEFKAVKELGEDSFSINRVDENTMMDIGFVISSHQPIVKFLEIISSKLLERESAMFKWSDFFHLDEDSLANICKILTSLCGRIYRTDYQDIGPSGNTPDKIVQKILVETGVAELTIEMVYHLFDAFVYIDTDTTPSDDRPIRNKISEIFKYSYHLLEKIAAGNMMNRIYMSRWVKLFLEHSNKINRAYIQECLVGILENNPTSIELTINEDIIENLIQACFQEIRNCKGADTLTIKYLRLFSTFIKCEDRVLKENQNIILNRFFRNENNQMSFRFKAENKPDTEEHPYQNKEIHVAFGKQEFCTIRKFYKDWKSRWNYFMAYVDLLADICIDRNSKAIENVSALLQLRTLVIILIDPQMKELNKEILSQMGKAKYPIVNVIQPFLRVAHYVYINNDKFTPIKRIKKISNWYKYENKEGRIVQDINHTKRPFEGEKEQEQKRFLMQILGYIKGYLTKCTQHPTNLSMIYTVLNILEETTLLGLWQDMQSFRDMIPDIVMRITKIQNDFMFTNQLPSELKSPNQVIQYNKRKLKMNRPEIASVIKCKVKATKIFHYMSEMEVDIRLRYMMNFFKGLYQATEKFEIYNVEETVALASGDELVQNRNDEARREYHNTDLGSLLGSIKKISEDQEIMMKPNIWYNKFKEMTPFQYSEVDDPVKNRYLFESLVKSGYCKFEDIVLSLFELSSYQSCELLDNSLRMLRTMFQQRSSLIESLKEILICGKGNLYQVYLTLKFMRTKFNMLDNAQILKQEQGLFYQFWKPYDHLIKIEARRSGLIQDLFFLSRTLKENISLKNIDALMYVDEAIFTQGKHYNYLNERQKNNQLFQAVNLAQGIYIPLINYIRIVGKNQVSEVHQNILFSIYQYLTLLCFNNLEVKQVLMQYIPDILPHLSRKVGASNFLYEVCINNKLLVNNEELVDLIIEGALGACRDLTNYDIFKTTFFGRELGQKENDNQYEKSKILYSLRGILLFNDEGNRKNQWKLMNRIQDNTYRSLIYTESTPYTSKLDNFTLNPREFYIATIFELFSVLVQSKNSINIGKLQNVHKYPYLLQCLKQTNRWEIRRSIRSYMNRLYYVNKDRDIFLFEEFIREQLGIINKEFYDLIDLHKSHMLTDDLQIDKGIRFYYAKSQIMLMILQLMITLHEMFLKPEFVEMVKNRLIKEKSGNDKKVHDQLIRLLKNLGCMNILYPRTKPIGPFIRQIKKLLVKSLDGVCVKELKKRSQPDGNADVVDPDEDALDAPTGKYIYDHSKTFFRNLHDLIRDIKSKEKIKNINDELLMMQQSGDEIPESAQRERYLNLIFSVPGETSLKAVDAKAKTIQKHLTYNPHIQTSNSKIFKVLAKRELGENQENIELNRKMGMVKDMIEDLPMFKKFKQDQFTKLVSIFSDIDQTSLNFYPLEFKRIEGDATQLFSMNEIITSTFDLMRNNISQFQDSEIIFVIKLIRCYITEAVEKDQDYKLPIDAWDNYGDALEDLTEFNYRQKRIQKCGGSAFIAAIFKENYTSGNRLELLNEALLLGIAYLFSGTTTCQDSLLDELKGDPENAMMVNMNKIISSIGEFLINVRKIKEGEKKRQFAYQIVDTYDYYSTEDNNILKEFGSSKMDKFQIQTEMNFEKALCRTFRFLQLFCENNNIKMKEFIHEQINPDGQKKDGTIDFILTATTLLRSVFKVMNNKLVTIPKSVLDFLTETTQTPCFDNQMALMKSTFIEDISYMAKYFYEEKENLLNRKFNKMVLEEGDSMSKLTEIYEMSMGMILINFQGNDNELVSQFLQKCQPVFFWQIIRQNMLSMLKERQEEYGIRFRQDGVPQEQGVIYVDNDESDDSQLANTLFHSFGVERIKYLISQQQANQMNFQGPIDVIIQTLCIFKKLSDFADDRLSDIKKAGENANQDDIKNEKAARDFKEKFIEVALCEFPHIEDFLQKFDSLILMIEITANNGITDSLQKVYFANQPVFDYLSPMTRDNIMTGVGRQTQRDKLRTLLQFRGQVNEQIEVNYKLNYEPWKILKYTFDYPVTAELTNSVRINARRLSCAICLMMLLFIFVDHDMEEQSSIFTYNNMIEMGIIKGMCLIQLVMTLWFCYLWLLMRKPLALKKLKDKEEGEAALLEKVEESDKLPPPQPTDGWGQISNILATYAASIGQSLSGLSDFYSTSRPYLWIFRPMQALFEFEIAEFIPISIFLFASLAGNYLGVEWFTIHIFDFFVSIPILSNVFKSVFKNLNMLVALTLLATCFILVFNVISLGTYTPVIWEGDFPEDACQEIMGCVLQMYTAGPVGGEMDDFQLAKFLFDIGYLVFMEMMFQNIVGGLMMDTYAGLCEADGEILDDKETYCYICGLDKPGIEKIKELWEPHIHRRHFLWNYIYYIYTLERKSPTDYSGIEYKVFEKIEKEDVTWFPNLTEGGPDIQEMMGGLQGKIEEMNERSSKIREKNSQYMETVHNTLQTVGNQNKKLRAISAR